MTKIFLLLAISLAVIHRGNTANTDRVKIDDKISFKDEVDESEGIRERIRTEMDNYKRIKEMTFKKKMTLVTKKAESETSSTTEKAAPEMITTVETEPDEITAIMASPIAIPMESTTEASAITSSTIRKVVLFIPSDDDEEETSTLDDRYLFNAPTVCQPPRRKDQNGKCRDVTFFEKL